ncbi:disease resistance protein RGA5-like [Miscanthus floridulus]|uniref:disease resistance protein RGA5-like n=1 Tax=Miscanthus floridulus TaxID=154761 RepID=UPI003459D399
MTKAQAGYYVGEAHPLVEWACAVCRAWGVTNMPLTVESVNASTVRSYISFSVADRMPPLSKFELLRVLDMEDDSLPRRCLFLSAVNHFFLLKYVRVHGFLLELPKKFGKLKHLMTLDMPNSWLYGSSEQLVDFNSLSSLRHLRLPEGVVFKNGLSKLCNLHDLSKFDVGTNSIECIRDLGEFTNLRNLNVMFDFSRADGVENNKLGNSNLRHLDFQVQSSERAPSAQFWSNCLTRPRHLQRLRLNGVTMPKLPNWIAHADRLADVDLSVHELRSDDVQVLAQLPCLTFLDLSAKTIPENIIIHPNTFHGLKRFKFWRSQALSSRLTFEPDAMPWLQILAIIHNAMATDTEEGAMQLQEGSPVGGIEHLASLEGIGLVILAKCDQGSKIESAYRDAINSHPKSQAMKIDD